MYWLAQHIKKVMLKKNAPRVLLQQLSIAMLLFAAVSPGGYADTKQVITHKKPQHKVSRAHKKIKKTTNKTHHALHKHKNKPSSPFHVSPSRAMLMPPESFLTPVQNDLVGFVKKMVKDIHYSRYKLGGAHFDVNRGVYIIDCSNFVDHILQEVSPHAYSSLVNSSGSYSPATLHYYEFFTDLPENAENYWNKVDNIEQLQPGDILVFRKKNIHGRATSGHVMVVMNKPVRDTNVYFVRVADSAPARHSQDTRKPFKGGIGIGTLLLKTNPKTGKPAEYAWGVGGAYKQARFAMARPMDVD